MEVYRSDGDYKIVLSLGIAISVFCAFVSITFLLQTGNLYALSLLIPAIAILYFVLFSIPREISLEADRIVFRTLFRKASIELSSIKAVRNFYSTNNLARANGDKARAAMLCFLRIKRKPWRIAFFGNHILEYKALSDRLQELIAGPAAHRDGR